MKKRSFFSLRSLVWIYLLFFLIFNQKVIGQTKKKIDLLTEDIIDRDMLDNSSSLRRTYNKTAGFNGKTFTKPIKYYIHDKNGKVILNFEPFTVDYAYEVSNDVERFIVDTFNIIDDYINLDFKRVYSPEQAHITIYKTNKFPNYDGYSEFQWDDDDIMYSQIVWHAYKDANKQTLKDYPTFASDYATVLLHEIAHSLGLLHSGCGQDWCKYNFDPENNRIDVKDTIMSYNFISGEYISLTKLDIAALQEIWGEEKDN